ncbi:MAG: hypothetical protein IT167_18280 [Bryobacterales bacterium]|nr:hypothetical protein [Bryobacterales bacterium]
MNLQTTITVASMPEDGLRFAAQNCTREPGGAAQLGFDGGYVEAIWLMSQQDEPGDYSGGHGRGAFGSVFLEVAGE